MKTDQQIQLEKENEQLRKEVEYYKNIASNAGKNRIDDVSQLAVVIAKLNEAKTELEQARHELEEKVQLRTEELSLKNQQLQKEIAEREQLEAQILHAQKMQAMGTLAGGIAHDFNNMLSVINGNSELIKSDSEIGTENHENAAEILKAGQRARELVKQILQFSRKADHRLEYLNPHTVIKESLKMLRSSLPSTVIIEEEIDSDCGMIFADPTNMHQIVLNLCTNSFHALFDEKGTIRVRLARIDIPDEMYSHIEIPPGSWIVLQISDNGRGIDPAIRDRIFEPYFTTKEVGKGTGLGLAVVHGIIKDYKGHILVDCEPGENTTFSLYFPFVQQKKQEEKLAIHEIPESGTEHIMVLDDEEDLVRFYANDLRRLGYQVSEFTNSSNALMTFKKDPSKYDLVFVDYTMPHMTGMQIATEMLKISPDTKIILNTGFYTKVSEDKVLEAGIKAILYKPIPRNLFFQTIRKVLDLR